MIYFTYVQYILYSVDVHIDRAGLRDFAPRGIFYTYPQAYTQVGGLKHPKFQESFFSKHEICYYKV